VVASHYLDAFELAPDAADATEIRARAGERLARAGERAASLGASEEGERYFTQAADLSDDPERRAAHLEQAGRMAWLGARRERARALLEEAHSAFEVEGLKKHAARVSAVLGEIDFREGHPPQAVARLESALSELESEDPDNDVAEVAAQLGRFLVLDGQFGRAAPHLERALELAEALRLPEVFVQALTSKSFLFTSRNRLEEARILLEGALDRALEQDLHSASLRTRNNLGVVLEAADRYADAVDTIDGGVDLARRVGNRLWVRAGVISSLVLLGRWDEALERAAELDGSDDQGLLLPLVTVSCERGDVPGARQWLSPALRESEDAQVQSGIAVADATLLRAEGKLQEALDRAESAFTEQQLGISFITVKLGLVEALEAAFALGDADKVRELVAHIDALRPGERPPLLDAHAHRFRAKLSGEESEFTAATKLFRELSLTFSLAVTLLEHGELTGDESLLAEAREIFEGLRAMPWLERLDALPPKRAEVPV
jgi:tetratricopeptide (TPR) repeat protein